LLKKLNVFGHSSIFPYICAKDKNQLNTNNMKYEQFTEEMRNEIVSAVKKSLLKLGINVDVSLSAETRRNGDERIEIETSTFQTTPVIYESIYVYGFGYIVKLVDTEHVHELNISLSYRFKYFDGGTNGVTIGTLKFRIFNEETIRFIGFTI